MTEVGSNIVAIFDRRKAAVYALCLKYAAQALNTFRANQAEELYWHNQTGDAMRRVFAEAENESEAVGWFIAHAVEYGVYLELANDREHEALRPVVESIVPQFMDDLRAIYGLGTFQLGAG